MQISSLLDDYTSGKAREGIEKLIRMTPRTARVRRDGKDILIPAEEVVVGDVLTVIAGETVPVDGTILEGETSIDQSVMTGESIPVDKKAGDTVSSGTINQFGTFTMRADAVSGDSSLQRMIRLAREAEENRAPIVTQADRWATCLVVIALSCAVLTWLFTGEVMRAVTVLVVFCPCAFILATPTAVLAGIGNAAKYGIIIRSGEALEKFSRIRAAAFDKTGTLTLGKPQVTKTVSCDPAFPEEDVLKYLALAEQRSEHPLGKAIVSTYASAGGVFSDAEDFKVLSGQGISAVVNGKSVLAGNADFMKSQGVDVSTAEAAAEEAFQSGATVVYLGIDGALAGLAALSDTLRGDAGLTIDRLKAIGITPMLLTGDHAAATRTVARAAGIDTVYADLLPEEKMRRIRESGGDAQPVCMIGDGVNDALALTGADAGIAMGAIGSDIAIESADAVLVSDEIRRLPYLFTLTRKVMQKVWTNIVASVFINLTAVVLSALGVLTPVTGALWHNFGSVFVVVNAASLLRIRETDAA